MWAKYSSRSKRNFPIENVWYPRSLPVAGASLRIGAVLIVVSYLFSVGPTGRPTVGTPLRGNFDWAIGRSPHAYSVWQISAQRSIVKSPLIVWISRTPGLGLRN